MPDLPSLLRPSLGQYHLKSSDHIPIVALGMVVELSNRIPRRQPLDAPLFRHDALVARYDERSGVHGHGTPKRCIYPPIRTSGLSSAVFDTPRAGKGTPFGGSFLCPATIGSKPPATAISWIYPWLWSASPSCPPKKLIASSLSMSCGRSTTLTTACRVQIASSPSHGAQSRTAERARSVDCNWAEGTASLVSGRLHQSKAGRTAALIRAIAAADPGVGRASRKTSPATAPGAALVDASRCWTSDSIGDGGVPGRPEPLRQWQERSQLHRNDPL